VGDVTNTIAIDQIAAFTNNPAQMFPAAIVAIAVGYIYYVYAFRIARREKVSTVPVWLHAFFLADDSTAAVVFFNAARNHDWFWFYILFAVGMLVWVGFEIYCIWFALKHERLTLTGDRVPPLSMKQGWAYAGALYLVSLCVVNLVRTWTGDEVMMIMFTVCNILAVTVPPIYWLKSPTREGASMGMAINMILIAFTNFLPPGFGWWTTASAYFDHPVWYVSGVVITGYAIAAAVMLSKKPAKVQIPGQPKPIW